MRGGTTVRNIDRYLNPQTVRFIYVLLSLVAMVLAGGAPDSFGRG